LEGGGGKLLYYNDVDYINTTALDYLVDNLVADVTKNIANIVGSQLSYYLEKNSPKNEKNKKYFITNDGMVCIDIERIINK